MALLPRAMGHTHLPAAWHARLGAFFSSQSKQVFSKTDLADLLQHQRRPLRLPSSLSVNQFVRTLQSAELLQELRLVHDRGSPARRDAPHYAPRVRYVSRQATAFDIGLSLRPNSYISHGSALFLHGLRPELGSTLYVNKEQSAKPQGEGSLTQVGIDTAFKNSPRVSGYAFSAAGQRFLLLNGKHTERAGVLDVVGPQGRLLQVTSIERTLIDIVVRPVYADGPPAVLAAYRAARGRVSAKSLTLLLSKLDHLYPYHQAIGFYMDRSGYETTELAYLRGMGMSLDFYLANGMKDMAHDAEWRIYYPRELEPAR